MASLPLSQVLHGHCTYVMQSLPDASIDLIYADPPYNLQLRGDLWRPDNSQVNPVDDLWDDFDSYAEYDAFTRSWLYEARRVMKPRSSIWISGSYHNLFRVGKIMQDMGFWVLNTVTWFKRDATPNFNGTRLKNDMELLIWAKASEAHKYTFHYQQMKQFNDGKQLGSVWEIPKITRHEQLTGPRGNRLHSTQKPEALLRRVIMASSSPGDVVLDPFFGSGTTGAVAKRLHRDWIGIEINPAYVTLAQDRIHAVTPVADDHPFITEALVEPPQRVSFRRLLCDGYLKAGQALYLDKPDYTAEILPNGRLQVDDSVSTIHLLARKLKNVATCNGWQCWLYEDANGERHPINDLRKRFRREMRDFA